MLPYAIAPELRMPPPRPARLPVGLSALLTLAALLLALFLAAGLRVTWEAVSLLHLNMAGQTVLARVNSLQHLPVTPGQKPADALTFSYQWPFAGQTRRTGQAHAPAGAYHAGDSLPVRCAVWYGREMASPGGSVSAGRIAFLAACGLLLTGICLILVTRLFRWRSRRLFLLRRGEATVGTIIFKRTESHDTPRCFVRFGYMAAGQPQERDEQVTAEAWKRADIGQPVTVLFDPARPSEGTLYGP